MRHVNTIYFIWIFKKIKLKPAIIWKLVTCQRITSKNTRPRWVNTWARDTVKWYWSADTLFWQLSIDHNIDVQWMCALSVFLCSQISYLESTRLNIDCELVKQLVSGQLPNKSRHLNELTHEPAIWSWDTGQWLSCLDSCQLTILLMSYIKDVGLPRHAWDTPPILLIASPTPPVQSVDAYTRSITWQLNEKRLTIFHEYGGSSHARFSRRERR